MADNQIKLFENKEKLLEEATKLAEKVEIIALRKPTKLYYITRYFVAVYESRYGEIPIQVWNEYRNALDHYFRHITHNAPPDKSELHLYKMEGHLQRAALDVLKLLCHRTQDSIKQERESYSPAVLRLVADGSFLSGLTESLTEAEKHLLQAKVFDQKLGSGAQHDDEVLSMYLDAAFSFDRIKLNFLSQASEIEKAQVNHDSIAKNAKHLSFFEEYGVHAFFYLTVFLFGAFIKDPLVTFAKKEYKSIVEYHQLRTSSKQEIVSSSDQKVIKKTTPSMTK